MVYQILSCKSEPYLTYSYKYGWVSEPGAREGSPANNSFYDNMPLGFINTSSVRDSVKQISGNIDLAQQDELLPMIINQLELGGGEWGTAAIWKNGFEGLFALLNLNRRDRITIDEFNWKFMLLIIDGKFCIVIVIRRSQYLIAICIRLCWVLNEKQKISEKSLSRKFSYQHLGHPDIF